MLPLPTVLLAALAGPASAARITVDPTGAGDATDVATALTLAAPGDHLVVEAGTYGCAGGVVGPLAMLGRGPDHTVVDGAGCTEALSLDGGALHLVAVGLWGDLVLTGGALRAEDLAMLGVDRGVVVGSAASAELHGVRIQQAATSAAEVDGALVLAHATVADATTGVVVSGVATVTHAVFGATDLPLDCLGAGVGVGSWLLLDGYTGSPWASCWSVSAAQAGVDPGWVAFSDDGDPTNDDLTLTAGSAALDAGDPACLDPDGTVCDLGVTGGGYVDRPDEDVDGLPDAVELAWGLDPEVDDAATDADADGLEALAEWLYGTDPDLADTDADGTDDLVELRDGFDPLDPLDGAPVAVCGGPLATVEGVPTPMDASASFDPNGDPLFVRWEVDSGEVEVTGEYTAMLTADAGAVTVSCVVGDGHGEGRESWTVAVLPAGPVWVPEDVEHLASLHLSPGLEVRLGPGDHALAGSLGGARLVGAGRTQTRVLGEGLVADAPSLLADLTVALEGSGTALEVPTGSRAWLHEVGIDAPAGDGLWVEGLLVAWDLEVASAWQALAAAGGRARVARGTLQAAVHHAIEGLAGARVLAEAVHLTGLGAVRADGPDTVVRLRHVAATGGLYDVLRADDGGRVEADATVLYGNRDAADCTDGLVDLHFVVLVGSLPPGAACTHDGYLWSETGIDVSDGVPSLGSKAWDGADPRELDPDGSVADVGQTGGRLGLQAVPPWAEALADDDGDGAPVFVEWVVGSDDTLTDTDGDGWSDLAELDAGHDPADPADHFPSVGPARFRVSPGVLVAVLPEVGEDPDGAGCTFSWDDGTVGAHPAVAQSGQGLELAWTVSCDDGARRRGTTRVVAPRPVEVPADASLHDALAGIDDRTELVLAPGDHGEPGTVVDLGDASLRGDGPATRLVAEVRGSGGRVEDLLVVGGVTVLDGEASRVEVHGPGTLLGSSADHVLVAGEAWLDTTLPASWLTVVGTARGVRGATACAVLGPQEGQPAPACHAADEDDFVFPTTDPFTSLWQPWPGSDLWDAGPDLDPDGTPGDLGYTGGPGATPTDADGDALNDRWEQAWGVSSPTADPDADTWDNLAEWTAGTSPKLLDTDGDGLADPVDPSPREPLPARQLEALLDASPRYTRPGEVVQVRASHTADPLGRELRVHFTVNGPGSLRDLGQGVAELTMQAGAAEVTALVEAGVTLDGRWLVLDTAAASVVVGAGPVVDLAPGTSVQRVVDEAAPGSTLRLAAGEYRTSLELAGKALRLEGAGGAAATLLTGVTGSPALTATDAHVDLESLTLAAGDGTQPVLLADGGAVVTGRRLLLAGGTAGVSVREGAQVAFTASAILPLGAAVHGEGGVFSGRNTVLGYGSDAVVAGEDLTARVVGSVVAGPALAACERCTLSWEAVLADDVTGALAEGVFDGTPGFLLAPDGGSAPGQVDLRLAATSAARDVGLRGERDADGSPVDLGALGGTWGNWPDVDDDRDGYTELDGDCDDLDPEVTPQPLRDDCEVRGCATRSGSPAGLAALLAWAWLQGRSGRPGLRPARARSHPARREVLPRKGS